METTLSSAGLFLVLAYLVVCFWLGVKTYTFLKRKMLNRLLHLIGYRHPDWRFYPSKRQMRRYSNGWQYREPTEEELACEVEFQANSL